MRKAYGGVVIDARGLVLLREPAGHYKGDVWTFAKGRPVAGESPEQTALREVLEETGYKARILAKIPGSFDGKRTSNEYFLMIQVENTQQFDDETWAIRWATAEEARQLMQLNRKPGRRRRDLRVLKLAFSSFRALERTRDVSSKTGRESALFGMGAMLPGMVYTAVPSRRYRTHRTVFAGGNSSAEQGCDRGSHRPVSPR